LKKKLLMSILPFLVRVLTIILGSTMRITESGNREFSPRNRKSGRAIYAFWHSRILMSVYYYRNTGINCLVSMGRDGEYISRVMNKLGYGTVRGSSSREGVKALILLKRGLAEEHDAAITPDGPKGPREEVKGGAIALAKISGAPIYPFGFDASRKIVLKSWDNFIIPLPFSRGVFFWGNPIVVPADADEALLEEKRMELQAEMDRVALEAGKLCR